MFCHTGVAAVKAAPASEPSCLVAGPPGLGGGQPDAGGSLAVEQPQTHLPVLPAPACCCVSPVSQTLLCLIAACRRLLSLSSTLSLLLLLLLLMRCSCCLDLLHIGIASVCRTSPLADWRTFLCKVCCFVVGSDTDLEFYVCAGKHQVRSQHHSRWMQRPCTQPVGHSTWSSSIQSLQPKLKTLSAAGRLATSAHLM